MHGMAELMFGMERSSTCASSLAICCAECGHQNSYHRHFCGICGEDLVGPCATCQFLNAVGDDFCGGCGGETPATRLRGVPARPRSALTAKSGIRARVVPPVPPLSPVAHLATRLRQINAQRFQTAEGGASSPTDENDNDDNELRQDQINDLFG